jgi:hypothetical protein
MLRAIDVVDKTLLITDADALTVDCFHQIIQAAIKFMARPLEPHAVLRHLQTAHRNAPGVGRFSWSEQKFWLKEHFNRINRAWHIGAFGDTEAAVLEKFASIFSV